MAIVDYNEFTEIDPNNRITIDSAIKFSYDNAISGEDACLYYDFGIGTITGDFTHYFDFMWDNDSGGNNRAYIVAYCVTNTLTYKLDNVLCADGFLIVFYHRNYGSPMYRVIFWANATDNAWIFQPGPAINTWWYTKIIRTGATGSAYFYSNSDYTNLIDFYSLNGDNNSYRYGYAMGMDDYDGTPYGWISGEIQNHDFGIIYNTAPSQPTNPSPESEATNVTYPTISLQVDVTDPDGDSMDVYFYDALTNALIGIDAGVASGDIASITLDTFKCGSTYQWYAIADDGEFTTSSATFTFTTRQCGLGHPLQDIKDKKAKYRPIKMEKGKYQGILGNEI